MNEHPIHSMMGVVLEKIKDIVDANTVIGDPVSCIDGTIIIPVSKISFGFGLGGSDIPTKTPASQYPFGGGSGAGLSVVPVAFLVVSNGKVELIPLCVDSSPTDKLIGMVPEVIDKISELFKNAKDRAKNK